MADMIHIIFNILEIICGLIFFLYLVYKGVKQKNHPKLVLGISFTIGVFATLFHMFREEFPATIFPEVLTSSIYYPFASMSILGFLFVSMMLLMPKKQEQLFLIFFVVAMFSFSTIYLDGATKDLIGLSILSFCAIVVPIIFGYLYHNTRDQSMLFFFIGITIFGITGFMSRINSVITHPIRIIAFTFMFLSFEYQSFVKQNTKSK